MMSTVKYRSSKEVISALKKAMKNQDKDNFGLQIGSDGDQAQDLAMDEAEEGSQISERELSVLEISSDSELSQSQPPPTAAPARNFSASKPPTQTQFFKSIVMLKGMKSNFTSFSKFIQPPFSMNATNSKKAKYPPITPTLLETDGKINTLICKV